MASPAGASRATAAAALLLVFSSSAGAGPPLPGEPAPAGGAEASPVPPVPGAARCALFAPGAERATASECLACHASGGAPAMQLSHSVDVDYATAQAANPSGLRTPAEVVRRGVLLPDGRIQCVTCHDGASRWASRIALPPGAVATPAVNPRDPATYLRGRNWRMARPGDPEPPAGSAVTPSPLCAACHTLAD